MKDLFVESWMNVNWYKILLWCRHDTNSVKQRNMLSNHRLV